MTDVAPSYSPRPIPWQIRAIIIDPFRREIRDAVIDNTEEEYDHIVGSLNLFGTSMPFGDQLRIGDESPRRNCFEWDNKKFRGVGLAIGYSHLRPDARTPLSELQSQVTFFLTESGSGSLF